VLDYGAVPGDVARVAAKTTVDLLRGSKQYTHLAYKDVLRFYASKLHFEEHGETRGRKKNTEFIAAAESLYSQSSLQTAK